MIPKNVGSKCKIVYHIKRMYECMVIEILHREDQLLPVLSNLELVEL